MLRYFATPRTARRRPVRQEQHGPHGAGASVSVRGGGHGGLAAGGGVYAHRLPRPSPSTSCAHEELICSHVRAKLSCVSAACWKSPSKRLLYTYLLKVCPTQALAPQPLSLSSYAVLAWSTTPFRMQTKASTRSVEAERMLGFRQGCYPGI